jgi:hypothetical protein
MSKATKLAKHKRSADMRRPRRGRKHRNPLKVGQFPPNFAPTDVPPVIDMLIGLGHLMRGFIGSHRAERAEKCACKGECPCHVCGAPFGGPCPPDCKHYGDHFDGCHRCDPQCQPPEKVQ